MGARVSLSIKASTIRDSKQNMRSAMPPLCARRNLPPLLLKGAAAMAEDADCISQTLLATHDDDQRPCKRRRTLQCSSPRNQILDAAARAEIVGYVGNCFGERVSTWPTLQTQGRMMCRQPFDFDHLFSTYRTYLDPRRQIGSIELEGLTSLEDVAQLVEKQIVPDLMDRSQLLQGEKIQHSRLISTKHCTCWNVSNAMHRVMLRTALLDHFACILKRDDGSTLTERETRLLLANIQTMIVKMQVSCSKGLNLNFVVANGDSNVHIFLDSNEQILEGSILFELCSHPSYRMNTGTLAQAVALYVVPRVHEACMNKEDMLHAVEQGYNTNPEWWLCNDEEQDDDLKPFANSTHLLPIVRLHPLHELDNDRLCVECRGIFEDPEMYWPFLVREEVVPYHGWVDFVAEEVVFKGERQVWLCAKLLADGRRTVY